MTDELPLITNQQNNFVKEYVLNNQNGTEAYRIAYNSNASSATCCVEASRLLKNPKITPWIEYYRNTIKQHITEDIKYSIDDAFREFDDMKIIALESRDRNGNPNITAANKAIEMKCKLKGLMSDDVVSNSVVVDMGKVEIDGKLLDLNIGDDIDDVGQSENTSSGLPAEGDNASDNS